MHTDTPSSSSCRRLVRGLAAGYLLTQTTLSLLAQTANVQTTETEATDATSPQKRDEVFVLETYNVTAGFRGSLAAAAEKKERAVNIVEVIAAEDIGKLPDVSIADSLTRLTGLTTQRTNGRSQGISVRGLQGDFSTGLLNGREQVSTNLNRSVEFDQYPAELLSSVIVHKTAEANLVGQGLAATVDLRTVRPLDMSRRAISVNAYYQWTEYGELTPGGKDTGERINVSYVDQFADGKFGIALGFAHTSTPWAGKQFQAWGYDQPGGNYLLGGTKSYVRTSNLDRDGFLAVLDFKPSSSVRSTVDIFSTKFEETQLLRGLEIPLAPNWTGWTGNGTVLQSGTTTGGYYSNAVISNVQPVVRNDIVTRDDDLISVGWNLKHTGAVWQTEFDAGYSKIDRTDRNLESWSGLGLRAQPFGATDTMTIQLRPGTHPIITPTIDYSNASLFRLTDPQGWGPSSLPGNGMYGYLKYFQAEDKLTQYKLSTKRELGGMFSEIEVGVSYTDRSKRDGEGPSGFLHAASASQPTPPVPALIGYTDMSFLGLGRIFAYDPLATYNAGILGYTENTDTGIVANRYQIDEELTRAFVQLGIDTKVGGLPLFGNIGLQVIHADQSSRGFSAAGNTLNAVRDSADYTDYAPSLNLNLVPAERTYVRFSAARQFARPRMFDMRASRTWSYNAANATQTSLQNSPWSGGGGNTRLRPWKANAFDVSFEKYFAENMGYFALTAFHKKLLNYIYQDNAVADFTGYPVLSGPEPALRQGIISTPVNGQGGSIKGLEFTLSLASELISPIKGFGVVLGGAYTDSSIKPWGPNSGDAPISGLARKVANATVYYENKGFSARVSQRYRSATREYVTNFGIPNPSGDVNPHGGFSIAQPESIMDAQVSYSVQNGRFKGLTLYIQGYNLTDEPLITYDNGDPRRVINHQQYGASYSAGVSFKF